MSIIKDLGAVTAYAYAVEQGYTGTEEEFATLMASYATVAQQAADSASAAADSAGDAEDAKDAAQDAQTAAEIAQGLAEDAQTAAETAEGLAQGYATAASTSAGLAEGSATAASGSASAASGSAGSASGSAIAASGSATEASGYASSANSSKLAAAQSALDAKDYRDTALTYAERAEAAAQTLVIDTTLTQSGQAADAKVTGDEIADVKADLDQTEIYQSLLAEEIPDTVQNYTFSDGSVTQITHVRNADTIRTDAYTYGTGTIIEVRTLGTGESLTITTNLDTLETSVVYAD